MFPNQPICPLVKSTYQVHKGGYDRYKLIADDQFFKTLIEIMKSTSVDTVNLYGHSMGCWPATFLTMEHKFLDTLYTLDITKLNVVLYAPPNIGNEEFAELAKTLIDQAYSQIGDKGEQKLQITVYSIASTHDLVHHSQSTDPRYCNVCAETSPQVPSGRVIMTLLISTQPT